jgi:hypothetical protein
MMAVFAWYFEGVASTEFWTSHKNSWLSRIYIIEKISPDESFHYIHAIRVKFNHANK